MATRDRSRHASDDVAPSAHPSPLSPQAKTDGPLSPEEASARIAARLRPVDPRPPRRWTLTRAEALVLLASLGSLALAYA
ncbi:MAG: hypothetical protein AB7N65_12855, partial [Vicinamibacterales bacterium]